MVWLRLALALAALRGASAYSEYQERIPNGKKVPGWQGVGHERPAGGGVLNPFGKDFKAAGHRWTRELCEKDSDGDGVPNGVELGDPYCAWQEGQEAQFDAFITHPGVKGNDRAPQRTFCPDYVSLAGETKSNFTFPAYNVPVRDTTYAKYAFAAPSNSYVTRLNTIIDKSAVVHHMLLYACTASNDVSRFTSQPQDDGRMPCTQLVYAWAVGGGEFCFPANTGIKIGADVTHLLLEIHYDNPKGLQGLSDSSGLEITYSPVSAVGASFEQAAWSMLGINFGEINIPPGLDYYEIQGEGTLYSDFVSSIIPPEGLEVFATANHAHLLGRKLWATIKNPGEEEFTVSCDPRYDFSLQEIVALGGEFNFRVKPGATIRTHCVYDSTIRNFTTRGGDETTNEMCIVLFLFKGALDYSNRLDLFVPQRFNGLQIGSVKFSESPIPIDKSLQCSAGDLDSVVGATQPANQGVVGWINSAPRMLAIHGWLMISAWVAIFPVATLIPLLFKRSGSTSKAWFYSHIALVAVGLCVVIASVVVAYKYKSSEELANFSSKHAIFGLAIVALAGVQALNGLVRPKKAEAGETASTTRKAWQFIHPLLGRLSIVLAAVNIGWGLDSLTLYAGDSNAKSTLLIIVYSIIGAWAVFSAVFSVYSWRAQQRRDLTSPKYATEY